MNTCFVWDGYSLFQTDKVIDGTHLIQKDMARESISKMKNGKAAGSTGLVSEMVNSAGEVGVDIITNLLNEIIVGVILAEWELSTIVNCYKGKRDALQKGNYRELKSTDQILKIVERVNKMLIREQADNDEMYLVSCQDYKRFTI